VENVVILSGACGLDDGSQWVEMVWAVVDFDGVIMAFYCEVVRFILAQWFRIVQNVFEVC